MTAESSQTPKEADALDILRGQVDELDQQLVALLSQRTAFAQAIGLEKQRRGERVMVSDRHAAVVGNYIENIPADSPLLPIDAVRVAEAVMEVSREAQERARRAAQATLEAVQLVAADPSVPALTPVVDVPGQPAV